MLSLKSVEKRYGQRIVLSIPKLEIRNGIHWLRGTNGSGKSTFLKMLGGLIPFDGKVELDNIDIKKSPVAYRRLVSYAEAEPLYPEFVTGEDLIHFYSSIRKSEKKKASDLMERFGIQGYYKNQTGAYSSGMTKKLSLVLAFLGDCQFIFLDEPLVTLDTATVKILTTTIKEFHQNGTQFIFTSHQASDNQELKITSELLADNNTVCYL